MNLVESITYSAPTHPQYLLYDFYIISYIRKLIIDPRHKSFTGNFNQPEHLKDDIDYATEKLYPTLKSHILSVLFLSIVAEFRHAEAYCYGEEYEREKFDLYKGFFEIYNPDDDDETTNDRHGREIDKGAHSKNYKLAWQAVRSLLKKTGKKKQDFVKVAKEIFGMNWEESYGGQPWVNICDAWFRLDRAKSFDDVSVSIDHVYDLQHNSGFALNKLEVYRESWVARALDRKRDATDIRQLIPYASGGAKKLALQMLRAAGVKSSNNNTPVTTNLDKIVWSGGEYNGGVWDKGTWGNGTWMGGTWKNGTWENGIWKHGVWEAGHWKKGTWESGLWKDGQWSAGRWESGIWTDGWWKGGNWIDGQHLKGIWSDGNWMNGDWKWGRWDDGRFYGGTWHGGNWWNGRWLGGTWKGGTWINGYFLGGTWEDGSWEAGSFKGGTWNGGTWRGGSWEGGSWTGGTWITGLIKSPVSGVWERTNLSPPEYYKQEQARQNSQPVKNPTRLSNLI
jgi:hypothetical protein